MSDIQEPIGVLLPCPICGEAAQFGYSYSWARGTGSFENHISTTDGIWVSCSVCSLSLGFECGCDYDNKGEFATFEDAASAWNRRT